MNCTIKNAKLYFGLVLILCLLILLVLLYLDGFGTDIVDYSLSNLTHLSFYDSFEHKSFYTKIRKYNETALVQIPKLMQKVYAKRGGFRKRPLQFGGVLRYLILDLRGGRGGVYDPDITTKLAHNSLIIYKKKWPLLSEEQILAEKIRKKYSEEEILNRYLNQIYFGNGIFGAGTASRSFFGKKVSDLKTHQIALLVCLGTDYYNGDMSVKKSLLGQNRILKQERDKVIDGMKDRNFISRWEAERSKKESLRLNMKN